MHYGEIDGWLLCSKQKCKGMKLNFNTRTRIKSPCREDTAHIQSCYNTGGMHECGPAGFVVFVNTFFNNSTPCIVKMQLNSCRLSMLNSGSWNSQRNMDCRLPTANTVIESIKMCFNRLLRAREICCTLLLQWLTCTFRYIIDLIDAFKDWSHGHWKI